MDIANTRTHHVSSRWTAANHPWQSTGRLVADSDILRQELQRVARRCDVYWRKQSRNTLHHKQTCFYERSTSVRARSSRSNCRGSCRSCGHTQTDMLHELFRMEHIAQTHSFESADGDPQPQKIAGRTCRDRGKEISGCVKHLQKVNTVMAQLVSF